MNVYDEFIDKMEQNNLDKGAVIDVLNIYVNGGIFLQRLEEFISKEGERREYNGVIYSDEYEQDDEGYFGEDKVLFYSGDGDEDYDIVNYDELYKYLSVACKFYIEKNPEEKESIEESLVKIKEKYNIK
ncbi:ribonuclease toxin immunity protein CdiI [Clostridium sporogenes]|uniref:ribonuclease toxin immunity protein CdiI n=1 Tax=Clostridium sporogenes TaxID=1509 RepID=UPI0029041C93|nr:ribonuclease toxin immunity protein CdiI [Clostridium botulinum]